MCIRDSPLTLGKAPKAALRSSLLPVPSNPASPRISPLCRSKAVSYTHRAMKLKEASKKVEDGLEETLTYCDFPSEHWNRIRTNNVIERLNREIRRRTRVVGSFPDGNSALMLSLIHISLCIRDRAMSGNRLLACRLSRNGTSRMDLGRFASAMEATALRFWRSCQPICEPSPLP